MVVLSSNPPMSLEDFRWKNRLLVIFGEEAIDQKLLASQLDEIQERKLIIMRFQYEELVFSTDTLDINVESFLKLKSGNPQADWMLIGLDGGVKSSGKSEELDLLKTFKRIDSMPMRQSEMRKDGRN
jgi:hypothetical protein